MRKREVPNRLLQKVAGQLQPKQETDSGCQAGMRMIWIFFADAKSLLWQQKGHQNVISLSRKRCRIVCLLVNSIAVRHLFSRQKLFFVRQHQRLIKGKHEALKPPLPK